MMVMAGSERMTAFDKAWGVAKESIYCDHCAERITAADDRHDVGKMPVDFDSGNAGESAVLCPPCYGELVA